MENIIKRFLGIVLLIGGFAIVQNAEAEPIAARLAWDYAGDLTSVTFTGYRDGVEVCQVVAVLECAITIEPGAYSFTVTASNLWDSKESAPFLSPPVPAVPSGARILVP